MTQKYFNRKIKQHHSSILYSKYIDTSKKYETLFDNTALNPIIANIIVKTPWLAIGPNIFGIDILITEKSTAKLITKIEQIKFIIISLLNHKENKNNNNNNI